VTAWEETRSIETERHSEEEEEEEEDDDDGRQHYPIEREQNRTNYFV
jgi:hypothetical protein